MSRNPRGRKVGGSTHSRIIGSLTQRLALDELLSAREERARQYEAAQARWEASQIHTTQSTKVAN